MNDQIHSGRRRRGKGIGTVLLCFVAAIALAGVIDHDHRPHSAEARAAVTETQAEPPADGRLSYRINKGHVVVTAVAGPGRIDLDDDIQAHAKVTTDDSRTTIKVDDAYSGDGKIRIQVSRASSCRIELAAGLLEVRGLPCGETDLTVRSGKMEVEDIPGDHGRLSGSVSVGTVIIDGGKGRSSKSSGVGDLRAELPAAGAGPSLTARVDVGMLTVDAQ